MWTKIKDVLSKPLYAAKIDDAEPIELTDALPTHQNCISRKPVKPWMARASIAFLVLPFLACFLWSLNAARTNNDFYSNLVSIFLIAPLFTWVAFFFFVLGAAFGVGSLARKEKAKIFVSITTTINILFALSSVPYMSQPATPFQNTSMGKKITSKSELKNFQQAIQAAGLTCTSCNLALDRGEGFDTSLGKVGVVWVDCGYQKYTTKTELSNPNPEAAVTLFFYGWIP